MQGRAVLSVSITPVARGGEYQAGIAWTSWLEALLSCAAIAALLPLFAILAGNDIGRDARFASEPIAQSQPAIPPAAGATRPALVLNAAKNDAMRTLLRNAGWQWAGAMLLGLLFVQLSRRLRSAGPGVALALVAWAAAAWAARVPWPLASEHAFVTARAGASYASPPAPFVLGIAGAGAAALAVSFALRRYLRLQPQTVASRVGYPGFVLLAGIGFLVVLDLSANASFGNRYLALYHQGHLWLAMLCLSVIVFLRQPLGRALAWTLSMVEGVAAGIAYRLGGIASGCLLVLLAIAGVAAFGALLANLRQVTSEIGRMWLMLGAAWFFFMRGTPLAERLARSGSSFASLVRYVLPIAFVVAVLIGAMFATHDMGPLLIAGYGAGAFLAASVAMWMHQRFGTTVWAQLVAVALFVSWIVLVTTALFELGAVDEVTAGRLENLAAPLASANDQLALVTWFQQVSPPAGFGLGAVPWCGYGGSVACAGVPAQIQSDYTFTALVGVFGAAAAWTITIGCAVWLHRLIRHHGRVTRGEPRLVASSGRMVNDEQALVSWLAVTWVVLALCQLAVTVAGNLAVIPLTGVTFPFVSFGMTSLVVNAAMLALCLNLNLPSRERA
jgi:cell division protein FtsW (lipid II flippase)